MLKKLVIGLGLIIVVLVAGIAIFLATTDFNKYKPLIVEKAKDATGFDVKIDGDIKPSFFPLGAKVNGFSIANPQGFEKGDMLKLGSFSVVVELKPLLSGKILVDHLLFSDIDLNIIKSKSGKFNFETKPKTTATKTEAKQGDNASAPDINVSLLKFKNINVKYSDLQSDVKAKVERLNVEVNNIIFANNDLSLKGNIDAKQLSFEKYALDDIKGNFSFAKNVANLENLEYLLFGSKAKSTFRFNIKNEAASLTQSISELDMKKVGEIVLSKDTFKGVANLQTKLSFVGTNPDNIKRTLNGNLLLSAKDLHVKGYDIDSIVDKYSNTENLANDDGLGMIFGAFGEDVQVSSKTQEKIDRTSSKISDGATIINVLNAKMPISNGNVAFEDVAFATKKTLVAFKGSLGLPGEKINNIKIGALDKDGCVRYGQTIGGTFKNPKLIVDETAVSTVANIAGKFFSKVKENKDVIKAITCKEPFYSGVVANPAQ